MTIFINFIERQYLNTSWWFKVRNYHENQMTIDEFSVWQKNWCFIHVNYLWSQWADWKFANLMQRKRPREKKREWERREVKRDEREKVDFLFLMLFFSYWLFVIQNDLVKSGEKNKNRQQTREKERDWRGKSMLRISLRIVGRLTGRNTVVYL